MEISGQSQIAVLASEISSNEKPHQTQESSGSKVMGSRLSVEGKGHNNGVQTSKRLRLNKVTVAFFLMGLLVSSTSYSMLHTYNPSTLSMNTISSMYIYLTG